MRTKDKVLIALAVLIAASALAMSGSSGADPYLDVHHMVDAPAEHSDHTVSVKGNVINGTTTTDGHTIRFMIEDASGRIEHANKTLLVQYEGVLPDAFGPKMIVATGTLIETPSGLRLLADALQVGCSSKY